MARLAVYDIMGIQSFVFTSNEMKENIGASMIVKNILSEDLPNLLKKHAQHYDVDWQNSQDFKMLKDEKLEAEIVYIGGGNALVAFKDKEIEKKVTKAFSRRVFEKTYSLNVAMASINTSFESYQDDKKELFELLKEKKNEYIKTTPLLGVAITKQGSQTGLPITCENKYGSLTTEAALKIKASKSIKGKDQEMISNNKFIFTDEIDELGIKTGDSKIAVVHIDGNDMGNKIDKVMDQSKNYEDAVKKIRSISQQIDHQYKKAYRKTIQFLEEKIPFLKDNIKIHQKREKEILPIRNIILNGDDVTFVCNAKVALSLTEKFLKEINQVQIKEFQEKISACAGIAIINNHFPFSKAYQIAEECCANAKAKAKLSQYSENGVLSWLDFHIVFSGITTDLQTIRQNTYEIAELDDANIRNGEKIIFKQYNLLNRPYLIHTDKILYKEENFEAFKEIYKHFTKTWPRSRLKHLRETFMKGAEGVKSYLVECISRGYKLPVIQEQWMDEKKGFLPNQRTPYFDVLELLDIYIEMEGRDGDESTD